MRWSGCENYGNSSDMVMLGAMQWESIDYLEKDAQ